MKKTIYLFTLLAVLLCPGVSFADVVSIVQEKKQGISAMALRQKATDLAFAQAVTDAAIKMLPTELSVERAALLHEFYLGRAGNFVQGYRTIRSEVTEHGLSLTMDVTINRQAVRESLQKIGLYYTLEKPIPATFRQQGALDEVSLAELQSLMHLTGIVRGLDVLPEFILQRENKKLWRGTLIVSGRQWVAVKKEIADVWYELWASYFTSHGQQNSATAATCLRINGWFTPDGVYDFDQILQGWDSAVQDVHLVEMEMLDSGVTAAWRMRVLNQPMLQSKLDNFLLDRGLSYGFDGQEK